MESKTNHVNPSRSALRLSLIYALVGACWILTTDSLLEGLAPSHDLLLLGQMFKGLGFIAVTALVLYFAARHGFQQIELTAINVQSSADWQLLNRALSELGDVAFVVDSTRSISACFGSVESTFGYGPDELIGQSTFMLHVNEQSFDEFRELSETVLRSDGIFQSDFRMLRKDGSIFPTEIIVMALKHELDWQSGVIAIIRDISEIVETQARAKDAQKLESIGAMAGGLAHEINGPIAAIGLYASLIENDAQASDTLRDYGKDIKREVDHVHGVVRQTLNYARSDEDETPSPLPAKDLIDGGLLLAKSMLLKDHIILERKIPDALPDVDVSASQIHQVILNLLVNARDSLNEKFSEPSEQKKIQVSAQSLVKDNAMLVRISIADWGMGIRNESQDHLFEPFYTTKPVGVGTGLGLWISRTIVEEQGGQISFEALPEAACFHLELPAIEARETR